MTTPQKIRGVSIDSAFMKALSLFFSVALLHADVFADELQNATTQLAAKLATVSHANPDLVADVELFHKGVVWALRYDSPLTPGDESLVKKALNIGTRRVEALAANNPNWTTRKGKLLRGFVSAVDGSTQPYGVNGRCNTAARCSTRDRT